MTESSWKNLFVFFQVLDLFISYYFSTKGLFYLLFLFHLLRMHHMIIFCRINNFVMYGAQNK